MTLVDTRTPDKKRLISGSTGDWEVIIGMEVHAQVTSESKLFSGSSTAFGNPPNANVSFVDAAMPGMLTTGAFRHRTQRELIRIGRLWLPASLTRRWRHLVAQNSTCSSCGACAVLGQEMAPVDIK